MHFFVLFFFCSFLFSLPPPPHPPAFPQHTLPFTVCSTFNFQQTTSSLKPAPLATRVPASPQCCCFFFFKGKIKDKEHQKKKTAARHSPTGRVWPRMKQLPISFSRRRRRELEARKTRRKRKRKTETREEEEKKKLCLCSSVICPSVISAGAFANG